MWKAVQATMKSRNLPLTHWEAVLHKGAGKVFGEGAKILKWNNIWKKGNKTLLCI